MPELMFLAVTLVSDNALAAWLPAPELVLTATPCQPGVLPAVPSNVTSFSEKS